MVKEDNNFISSDKIVSGFIDNRKINYSHLIILPGQSLWRRLFWVIRLILTGKAPL